MSYYASNTDPPEWFDALEWTTNQPTQEGWYWAKHEDYGKSIVMVIKGEGSVACDLLLSLEGFTHWLGPLPEPEAPKE